IIAGFPGENEEQFNRSCQAAEQLPITHLHVFTYSKRAGTAAAALGGQIPEPIKKERSARLRGMFEQKQRRYWHSLAGAETAVLFERQRDGVWSGLGEHYFKVSVRSDLQLKNQLRRVKLTAANDDGMSGELVD
ncbi:MAG TPA: tRNA (N(6)-L-threonylcarbamoyladenosine(37)-C(2))-methylthiotransferase MtaB, partial [Candidatus Edwardsbacteria bacterium]|nr:tRNA (N(6)-L-threonylcarbamoyladenosine(37)-C(2))-methylthiotransferase MtaB [Candidatus Edwardsbacteria bacterium]